MRWTMFAMVNNGKKPSRRIQAPTDCLPEALKGWRAMRGKTLASMSCEKPRLKVRGLGRAG